MRRIVHHRWDAGLDADCINVSEQARFAKRFRPGTMRRIRTNVRGLAMAPGARSTEHGETPQSVEPADAHVSSEFGFCLIEE